MPKGVNKSVWLSPDTPIRVKREFPFSSLSKLCDVALQKFMDDVERERRGEPPGSALAVIDAA